VRVCDLATSSRSLLLVNFNANTVNEYANLSTCTICAVPLAFRYAAKTTECAVWHHIMCELKVCSHLMNKSLAFLTGYFKISWLDPGPPVIRRRLLGSADHSLYNPQFQRVKYIHTYVYFSKRKW